jgi:hypothetical protein
VDIGPEVSSVGIGALAKLKNLVVLLFLKAHTRLQLQRQLQQLELCAQLLPHLDHCMHIFDTSNVFDKFSVSIHDAVVLQPRELRLQQIVLSGGVQPHTHCLLPQLEGLFLIEPTGDVAGLCERFASVTTLSLAEATMDTVLGVLQRVGHRLATLALDHTRPQLSLNKALGCCPKLKSLTLHNSVADENWNVSAASVANLEEIHLAMYKRRCSYGFYIQVNVAEAL